MREWWALQLKFAPLVYKTGIPLLVGKFLNAESGPSRLRSAVQRFCEVPESVPGDAGVELVGARGRRHGRPVLVVDPPPARAHGLEGEAPPAHAYGGLGPGAPRRSERLLLCCAQLADRSSYLPPPQVRAGHVAEIAPCVLALLGEIRPGAIPPRPGDAIASWRISVVVGVEVDKSADPAPDELGHGEFRPGVGADPSQINVVRGKEELAQEPVDGVDVISPSI